MKILTGFLVCSLVLFGCDSGSDSSSDDREIGGNGGEGGQGGSDNQGGNDTLVGPECTDGVPVVQASNWASLLDSPATALEIVWSGSEFGMLWLASEASSGLRPLMFARASADGELLGDAVMVGQTSASSHKLVFTGTRYIVTWVNGRTGDDPYDGIRVGVLNAEGALAETTHDIDGTYNTTQLELVWDSMWGALLTYTRGSLGEGGLFSVVINEDGTLNEENVLDSRSVSSFSSVFGDGAWAVAYAVRDDDLDNPVYLHLLDENGVVYDPEPISIGTKPLGRVHAAFAQGNYAIVWSGMNQEDRLLPMSVLLDGAAEIIGQPIIGIDADFAVVEDVAVADDVGFVISWHGEIDSAPALGIQVMSVLGIPESSVMMSLAPAQQYSQSRLSVHDGGLIKLFSTNDPSPQPLGYSEAVNVQVTTLEACD
ncbi:MAG: hypothetical protein ACPGQS_11570 [Bradymonadia bacterium]